MLKKCIKDKRILNPIILEIDLSLIYLKETKFCYINAADSMIKKEDINDKLETFQKIRFDIINSGLDSDYKFLQAEVLVMEYVPINFILNFPKLWQTDLFL